MWPKITALYTRHHNLAFDALKSDAYDAKKLKAWLYNLECTNGHCRNIVQTEDVGSPTIALLLKT
jgi:hypothetical protein